jgi:hypothetical protein
VSCRNWPASQIIVTAGGGEGGESHAVHPVVADRHSDPDHPVDRALHPSFLKRCCGYSAGDFPRIGETDRASASLNSAPSPVLMASVEAIVENMKSIISRAALICAAGILGILASPSAAQQTAPDQPLPPAQQSAPSVPPAPPPDLQTAPEAPPPFPPMPSAPPRHRWVDVGDHRISHAHHRPAHAHHRPTHAHHRAMQRCRGVSHHKILRHSPCRAMMRHQHHVTGHRRHHVTHQHRAIYRHRRVHRHDLRHHRVVRRRAT